MRRFSVRGSASLATRSADRSRSLSRRCGRYFLSQNSFFDRLKPATDAQRGLVATAKDQVRKLADTQMLMARQLASPFPPHVLTVVVCWAAALFLGNGLVAAPNAVSVLAHFAGAISIGIAIFLILELSSPYTGLIRLSPAGIDRVLQILGDAERKKAAAE